MLADGAEDILGELVALVDPAADLADVALLARGFGLGLHILLVIRIGHGTASKIALRSSGLDAS